MEKAEEKTNTHSKLFAYAINDVVPLYCRDGPLYVSKDIFLRIISNHRFCNFVDKLRFVGTILFIDLSVDVMNQICEVYRGYTMSKPLDMKYYNIFKFLNIGHEWMFCPGRFNINSRFIGSNCIVSTWAK